MKKFYNDRLDFLDEINDIVKSYSLLKGIQIPNVSSWNTDTEFQNRMLSKLQFNNISNYDVINYFYSYNIKKELKTKVLNTFGANEGLDLLITPNNTVSLVNLVNFISKLKLKKIALLAPYYFTIPELLDNRKLNFNIIPMKYEFGQYKLPREFLLQHSFSGIILTSPIFASGKYLCDEDKLFLKNYLNSGGYIFADESLSHPYKTLLKDLSENENFLAIYSPHKYLHCNSIKFSIIVYNKKYTDFFDKWNDYYCGSLNTSTLQAIDNYLSDNFQLAMDEFNLLTKERKLILSNMLGEIKGFYSDDNVVGDYCLIHSDFLSTNIADNINFLKNLLNNTDSMFYPGCLHGYQKSQGFTFRLNLASFNTNNRNALLKILNFLYRFFY